MIAPLAGRVALFLLALGAARLRTATGDTVEQVVSVSAGDRSWPRPAGIGKEAALYVRRLPGVVAGESN
mgnify:CR=1 FL=1